MGDISSLESQEPALGSNGLSNGETLNGDVADPSSTRPHITPIAICGMAIRLPGGVKTTEAFWDALYEGKDMRSPIPKDRFNIDAFDDALGSKGVIRPRHGYFLDDDLACLDASFFGMSKAELEKTDPQQRQLLEVTRECLENAGEVNYRGKPVGCYVGTFGDDWMESQAKENQFTGGYNFGIGNDLMIANRVSFEYDFKGPSMVVKTGCSAAMVALHEACRAIQMGDCDSALVAGTSLIMGTTTYAAMSSEQILSPEGSCKTFDAAADGFARAEAINAIYIKPLSDAIRDNNPIRAVIRNSGTNSDGGGKSLSIMTPNAIAQEQLIRKVYKDLDLDPSQTAFFECHGTGTPTGDPIETNAIGNVFGRDGIYIGSVKPNFGHSEGASGLTSVIKAVMALEKRTIPPNIKFNKPNPKIKFEENKLVVPVKPMPWPENKASRISVNSFGIGGSNAHVIIDSASDYLPNTSEPGIRKVIPQLMLLSSHSEDSVKKMGEEYLQYIEDHPDKLADLAYTLSQRRERFPYRGFIPAGPGIVPSVSAIVKCPPQNVARVMVFSGQGAQWPEMGKRLLESCPWVKVDIAQMDKILQELNHPPSWSLAEELVKPPGESRVHEAEFSQPLCAAIQIVLVNSLQHADIYPEVAIGHSSGEIAAAYAVGILSLREAITISYYRGLATKNLPQAGGMAAIGLGASAVEPFLNAGTTIAAENSPTSTTVSGDVKAIEQLVSTVKQANPDIFARRLKVDMAYHSQHMIPAGDRYLELLDAELPPLTGRSTTGVMFSTVTGEVVDEPLTSSYWVDNMVSRVKFYPAFKRLLRQFPTNMFLEVGPHTQLAGPVREICSESRVNYTYIPTMIRDGSPTETLLKALGQVFQQGGSIRLAPLTMGGTVLTDLKPRPWDHSARYWYENRISADWRHRQFGHHALLGQRIPQSTALEPSWRVVVDLEDESWLADHSIRDNAVFPFTGYIAMAGEAMRQISGAGADSGYTVSHMLVHTALLLNHDKPVELVTNLRRHKLTDTTDSEYFDFVIMSYSESTWTRQCEGRVKPASRASRGTDAQGPNTLPRLVDTKKWYDTLARDGMIYGPSFRGMLSLSTSATQARAIAEVSNTSAPNFVLHPATMDACLQVAIAAKARGAPRNLVEVFVPTRLEQVDVFPVGNRNISTEAWAREDEEILDVRGTVDGETAIQIRGVNITSLGDSQKVSLNHGMHATARLQWFPDLDFMDIRPLFIPPQIENSTKIILEEMVLLCILNSAERVAGLAPGPAHMAQFRDWLNREVMRAQSGHYPIVTDPKAFVNLSPAGRAEALQQRLSLILSRPEISNFAKGIMRIHDNMADLFTGKADTLQLLIEDNVLSEIYSAHGFDMARFVRALCLIKPNLRILEVGAGTGGTTDLVLRELLQQQGNPPYSAYTFTDISEGFFPQAMQKFGHAPNMEYKTFDVGLSPMDQGFEPSTYDLILATNVIHATPNLKQSLSNLRPLLRADGHLVLCEVCAEARAPGYVFGNFSGWWLGEEDGRKWEPYVHPTRWDHELRESGFTGAEHVMMDAEEPFQFSAAILSRPATLQPRTLSSVTAICRSSVEGKALAIIEDLRSRGIQVTTAQLGQDIPADAPVIILLEVETPFFDGISADDLRLFQEFCRLSRGQKLLWVTPPTQINCVDPRFGQTIGALRVARAELALPIHTLEISASEVDYTNLVFQVLSKIHRKDDVDALAPDKEYAVNHGVVKVGRYVPFSLEQEVSSKQASYSSGAKSLVIGQPGRLETLGWIDVGQDDLEEDQVEVEAAAVGLNFRDLMMAMGIYSSGSSPASLGLEVSGTVTRVGSKVSNVAVGDRIMGLSWEHCFSTHPLLRSALCVRIPDSLGFEAAATMPSVYVSALQALEHVGRLQRGDTILIHSACGGVGHAAIALCKHIGAEIYVTVGTEDKVVYAEKTLGIPRNRIFSSRNSSFRTDLMRETNGRGVDLVLNSLAGKLLHESWECVAEFGKMVELGRRDLVDFGQLNMEPLVQNRSYCCVNVAHLMEKKPSYIGELLSDVVKLYNDGIIGPISPMAVFQADEVEQAFRYLQQGNHIGKAVVKVHKESVRVTQTPPTMASPRFDPHASYLLTGGLGGLGRSVATWMVENGARHLTFLSRSAASEVHEPFFQELKSMDCSAIAVTGEVQNEHDVKKAILASEKPIRGVLHLAMVLRDAPILDMSYEEWIGAVKPKVDGAWNLHNAFHGHDLDFFILASSLVALVDQPGQANYAAGNCFLESFCQFRRSNGLPCSVLGLCPLADAGFVAENPTVQRKLRSTGFYLMPEQQVLEFFQLGMVNQHDTDVENNGSNGTSDSLSPWTSAGYLILGLHSEVHLDDPRCQAGWRRDRRMGTYHNIRDATDAASGSTESPLKSFLARAADQPEILDEEESIVTLATEIGRRILSFLLKDDSGLDISMGVAEIGVDSLMAIELRRWWKQTFGLDITVLELLSPGTVHRLGQVASHGLKQKFSG